MLFPLLCLLYTFFHQDINELSLIKQLKYDVSLQYTKMTQSPWWNRIEPTAHYLGAQPQADLNHSALIKELGINSILMIVEEFEELGGLFHTPVQRCEWGDLTVKTIRARDFRALRFTEIDEGVRFLYNETFHNRSVYVHCKAGRGRSAAILWTYMTLVYDMDPFDALVLLTEQRPAINLNQYQRDVVLEFIGYIRANRKVFI
jgi:atypical dual specificity phosphatase